MTAVFRRVAGPAVIFGLALIVSVPPSHATTFPGQNGKIAWSTNRHDATPANCSDTCDWEIYTMNPDGTAKQRLTFNADGDTSPEWSPDGTKLAFLRAPRISNAPADIYVSNPDGSDAIRVATDVQRESPFSWAPDGTRIAYTKSDREIYVANTDGTGVLRLTNDPALDFKPVWSPNSQQIAWVSHRAPYSERGGVWVMDADGTDPTYVPETDPYSMGGHVVDAVAWAPGPRPVITTHYFSGGNAWFPGTDTSWAPDRSRLGFVKGGIASFGDGNLDIATINADGTDSRYVTTDPRLFEFHLEWAPDSSRFVYARNPAQDYARGNKDIFVVSIDGSGITNLTTSFGEDQQPSWQPVSFQPTFPGAYARPKGASPFKVSLVPAYDACTSPNATHGSPLDSAACVPPVPASTSVTVGTTDANGAEANSQASIRLTVQRGVPGPPEDSDVLISASVTDVRCLPGTSACGNANAVGGEDYIGELQGNVNVRVTDRFSESTGGERVAATVVDLPFPFKFPCADTSSIDEGAVCEIVTSYDAIAPGIAREGQRAIWDLTQANVSDGGPDGMTETIPNTTFLRQGIFVP